MASTSPTESSIHPKAREAATVVDPEVGDIAGSNDVDTQDQAALAVVEELESGAKNRALTPVNSLQRYLADIRRFERLSPEAEHALVIRYLEPELCTETPFGPRSVADSVHGPRSLSVFVNQYSWASFLT